MTEFRHKDRAFSFRGRRRQKGITLVELMIAGALGTFVLAGMIQVLSSSKETLRVGMAITELQEGGNYALGAVVEPLRYRGFQGCLLPASLRTSDEDNLNWDTTTYTDPVADGFPSDNIARTNLRGFTIDDSGNWAPEPSLDATNADIEALRAGIDGIRPRPGSDVVSVQYASPESIPLAQDMTSRSAPLIVTDTTFTVTENDLVYVGDCSVGDVFRVSNETATTPPISIEHANSHNTTANLRRAYRTDARLRRFRSETYFVGDSGRNNAAGDDIYSLFRLSANNEVEEIAEGVEYLKIRYGERQDNGNVRFVTADDAALNMRRVVSIEVGVLVKSTDPILRSADTRTYSLPGGTITAGQHGGGNYLRQVFRRQCICVIGVEAWASQRMLGVRRKVTE